MKRLMILFEDDFQKQTTGEMFTLGNLEPKIRSEEVNFDIVALYQPGQLTFFKNRFGSIGVTNISPELDEVLRQS
ncbi:hypothetical protein [Desulfonatronovibrio magnus]|uniref:hypothetical protein n=1 Tax=Desulfonatronovibrio magnus TaxID=698827 RepID=UPI0005EAC943|nr:hypothetical protein [Desulfonatronovibrio magnus]